MNYQEQVTALTPEVVAGLRRALELGRWPDGRPLSAGQRQHCMRALIHWEQAHLPQRERTGYIDRGHKAAGRGDEDATRPLRWDEPAKV